MFGEPISVVDFAGRGLGSDGEPHHDDAGALTERITASLQAVSPGFADVEEREVLRAAARIAQSDDGDPSFADAEIAARRLATAPAAARQEIVDAYRTFAARLLLIGITADQLRPEHTSRRRVALSVLALVFGGSIVVAATLIHLPRSSS